MPKQKEKKIEMSLSELISGLSQYLSGTLLNFVISQLKASRCKKQGRRWTPKDKSLALSIYHSSPRTYRILKKAFLLPSVNTLRRSVRNLKIRPGVSEQFLETFKLRVKSMSEQSKLCAIVFDEMSLKENVNYDIHADQIEGLEDLGHLGRSRYVANHAIVFMARGLVEKWKQPFAYYLSSSTMSPSNLKLLLLHCIDKLLQCGLYVKTVICDQGSNNRSVLEHHLGVTIDKPYFMFNDKRILAVYDPPHLLKNIRNNLKKSGFTCGDVSISWDYIVSFYQHDSQQLIRMAPRVTEKHINLPMFSKLRVKLAAQIISHSVAAGINSMVSLGGLPQEALETAKFLEYMDQLFNVFNSSKKTGSKKMGHVLTSGSSHFQFLIDVQEYLKSLSSPCKKLPCLEGWKLDINSLNLLWDDLHKNYGVKFFFTNRLNQDCAENLFSMVRGKGGNRDNPDACQFRSALCQIMVDHVLLTSKSQNCEVDIDTFMFSLKSLSTMQPVNNIPVEIDGVSNNNIPESVSSLMSVFMPQSVLSIEEENILVYIAGYICRKIQSKVCQDCKSMLTGTVNALDQSQVFLASKQYADLKGDGLTVPSGELMDVCTSLENEFRVVIEQALYMDSVKLRIVSAISKKVSGKLNCGSCPTLQSVVHLFVNIRLHHVLRVNNQDMVSSKGKRNRKYLKLSHV